jgi:ubiquinone/menaquinone biosynthesis C-methylase UbiE
MVIKKLILANAVGLGLIGAGVYLYQAHLESSYKYQYSSISDKLAFLKSIHSTSAEEFEKKVKHENDHTKSMRRNIVERAYGNVLEVGIGTGANFDYYKPGITLTGVDWSSKVLKFCKEKHKKVPLKVVEADLNNLPFEDNSFDCLVSTFTICSVLEPAKMLQEMKRVCKSDGRILMLEHGLGDTTLGTFVQTFSKYSCICTIGCYNDRDIDRYIEEGNFEVIKRWREDNGMLYGYVLKPKK